MRTLLVQQFRNPSRCYFAILKVFLNDSKLLIIVAEFNRNVKYSPSKCVVLRGEYCLVWGFAVDYHAAYSRWFRGHPWMLWPITTQQPYSSTQYRTDYVYYIPTLKNEWLYVIGTWRSLMMAFHTCTACETCDPDENYATLFVRDPAITNSNHDFKNKSIIFKPPH